MTKCDRCRKDNVWVEGVVDKDGNGGICLLDTMDLPSVVYVLQRDEVARADLYKVTTDPELLELADTVPPLPKTEEEDMLQGTWNKDAPPLYAIFRGQPPYAQ